MMLQEYCRKFWREFSLSNVLDDALILYDTDRWDTFDKFAETAVSLEEMMRRAGLKNVERLPVVTGGPVGDGTYHVKHTWTVEKGLLTIVHPVDAEPRTLADYHQEPLSLVMFSHSAPSGTVEAELVLYPGEEHGGGDTLAMRSAPDLTGKIVLTRGGVRERWVEVVEKGALGLITDFGLESQGSGTVGVARTDGPESLGPGNAAWRRSHSSEEDREAISWQKFGWAGWPPLSTKRCFGFSLPPSRGDYLRGLLAEGPVVLKAEVKTTLAEGTYYTVTGTIPGTDLAQEEVWVVAHAYEPGMCDDSMGCATAAEALRVINSLVEAGRLRAPRRTIRLVTMHEVYGLLAYLETVGRTQGYAHIVAGLNGDSPSARSAEGMPVLIHADPTSLSSFGAWVCAKAYDAAAATAPEEVTTWGWTLVPWRQNDQLMVDPLIGVTTSRAARWRDRFHHSSLDRPGSVSSHLARQVGVTTTAYLYALASAGPEEATSWAREMATEMKQQQPSPNPFAGEYQKTKLLSLAKLGSSDPDVLSRRLEGIWQEMCASEYTEEDTQHAFAEEASAEERLEAQSIVPLRKHIFVWDHENIYAHDLAALRSTGVRKEALFWADGRRDLWEIYQRERAEGQTLTLPDLIRSFQLLQGIGYLRLSK